MDHKLVFINRRRGAERRNDEDPCKDMHVDLYHRKRRKSSDRRSTDKSLSDDYYSFIEAKLKRMETQRAKQEKPNFN